MQNRYVADFGDYVKLALLRALAPDRKLGVVWWLFPDEYHNGDGGHREYLSRPNEWKHFDPELFELLLDIEKKKMLDVQALQDAAILPNTLFASDLVPCEARPCSRRPEERRVWLATIKTKFKDCNLIFLDPDNGIASEGLRLTHRRAGKSVTIEELKELQNENRAIVVYHHQTRYRGGHHSEICDLAKRLGNNGFHVSGAIRANRWSPRVFFLLDGKRELGERIQDVVKRWKKHLSWYEDFDSKYQLSTANTAGGV